MEYLWRIFKESGLADRIISEEDARGGVEIKFSNLPIGVYSNKHRNSKKDRKEKAYYGYIQDGIKVIISLDTVSGPREKCDVTLHSKYLRMNNEAVRRFRRGWTKFLDMYKELVLD